MITETNLKNIITPVINKVKTEINTVKTEMNKGWISNGLVGALEGGASEAVAVGTIRKFNTDDNVDNTWVKCDGSTLQIDSYPELANFYEVALGSKNYYGGDGETTFKIGSLNNKNIVGNNIVTNGSRAYEDENIKVDVITASYAYATQNTPNLYDVLTLNESTNGIYSASSSGSDISESNPFTILFEIKNQIILKNITIYANISAYCRCKDFIVLGSNDNSEFLEIGRFTYTKDAVSCNFDLDNDEYYRYIKLNFISTYVSGNGYSNIGIKAMILKGYSMSQSTWIKAKPSSCIQLNMYDNTPVNLLSEPITFNNDSELNYKINFNSNNYTLLEFNYSEVKSNAINVGDMRYDFTKKINITECQEFRLNMSSDDDLYGISCSADSTGLTVTNISTGNNSLKLNSIYGYKSSANNVTSIYLEASDDDVDDIIDKIAELTE